MSFKTKLSLTLTLFFVVSLFAGLMVALAGVNTVGDFVWFDENGNGNKDGITEWGDEGIDGVLVNLYLDDGTDQGVFDPGDTLTKQMTTGDNPGTTGTEHGWYDFVDLGDNLGWWVEIPDSNFNHGGPLEGYVYTGDSGPDPYSGPNPRFVHLGTGPIDYNDADFGFTLKPEVTIGNRVWDDSSGSAAHKNNGTMDADESGISGVSVLLYSDDGDGVCNPIADTLYMTTTTDTNGIYQFLEVQPGNYCVAIPDSSIKGLGFVESSTGGNHNPDASGDETGPNGDDGIPVGDYTVSQVLSATPGGQTDTSDTGDPEGWADSSSYMTVDFGFLQEASNAVSLRKMSASPAHAPSWMFGLLAVFVLIGLLLSRRVFRILQHSINH